MGKPRMWRQTSDCVRPIPQPPSPQPSSAFEGFFDEIPPRPLSEALPSGASTPTGAMGSQPPTLNDILLDVASPPWTLSAFMAYLSQNHCMESLEFTLDAQRYTAFYTEFISEAASRTRENDDRVCALWEKLIQVYIIPYAPREVNIPAHVRDHLLALPSGPSPPHFSELEEAGRIIYELMNDSVLVPFLESVAPMHLDGHPEDLTRAHRFTANSRVAAPVRSTTSMQGLETDGLTDDSDCNSPSTNEPMTPPTTPPTSEWAFSNSSPGGLQRANAMNHCSDLGQYGGYRDDSAAGLPLRRDGHPMCLVRKDIRMRHRAPLALKTAQTSIQCPLGALSQSRYPPIFTSSPPDTFSAPRLNDCSGFLPSLSDSCDDMALCAKLGQVWSCHTGTQVDTYGWEAEHDRRAQDERHEILAMSYRRANGARTTLLHRVLKSN
ncbi:RGS domain-containing protein [Mariannaea sp. PMI_226]|nr:RGS domain-containing protein [Mariannaea sp. PMI_226]